MNRLLLLTLMFLALAFTGACDKSKNAQEPQPEVKNETADSDQPAKQLPRLMANTARVKSPEEKAQEKPRSAYQQLKPFIAGELPFIGGAEIPKDQCPHMYSGEMSGFKREEIDYQGKDAMKIRTVLNRYISQSDTGIKIESDDMCMPLAGNMARCVDPNQNCGDDLQMSGFFLRMFVSENEGEMVQDVLKLGFERRNFVCAAKSKDEKGRGMSAWFSNDYKGNGVAMASVRRTDGWYISNCRSGQVGEAGLMSCLCSNLP